MHRVRPRARGFSLVEVAVVLVIIGLILAAVLQGRQLVASAEYKSLKQQLRDYQSAFYAFRDRYNALPGDFSQADSRLGLPSSANGDGDGMIDGGPACDTVGEEACLAWRHLRAAELIKGNPNDTGTNASPRQPYGGVVSSFFTGTAGNGSYGHKLYVTGLPVEIAQQLDDDIDDEQYKDGKIGCVSCTGSDWPATGLVSIVYAL